MRILSEPKCQSCLQSGHWTFECKEEPTASPLIREVVTKRTRGSYHRLSDDDLPPPVPTNRFLSRAVEEKKERKYEKPGRRVERSSRAPSADKDRVFRHRGYTPGNVNKDESMSSISRSRSRDRRSRSR